LPEIAIPSGEKFVVTAPVVGSTVGAGKSILFGYGGSVDPAGSAPKMTPPRTASNAASLTNRYIAETCLSPDTRGFRRSWKFAPAAATPTASITPLETDKKPHASSEKRFQPSGSLLAGPGAEKLRFGAPAAPEP
jgi:hypothetical protein